MTLEPTPITDLFIVKRRLFEDTRGSFGRLFCSQLFEHVLGGREVVQINHSTTRSVGTVRGLHYQNPPLAEMKLVTCLSGAVWDVAVDLRRGSPTQLQWHAQTLSDKNGLMMVIPEGFAHGFQALEPDSQLLYLHTNFYNQTAEAGLRHDDPRVSISWPLKVKDLSSRDRSHPLIADEFQGIMLP